MTAHALQPPRDLRATSLRPPRDLPATSLHYALGSRALFGHIEKHYKTNGFEHMARSGAHGGELPTTLDYLEKHYKTNENRPWRSTTRDCDYHDGSLRRPSRAP